MKILLIGSGGREHALALKLKASSTPVELVFAPGSDALGEVGICLPYGTEDAPGLADWCAEHRPDLVIIGPEGPLVAGVADAIREKGIAVFGHGAATARLEGSKAFAKEFMHRYGIPCASSASFTDPGAAEATIHHWRHPFPVVLKADGLAAGKGVVLADTVDEAVHTVRAFMAGQFGEASRTVVLEEALVGMELSLHVLMDVNADHGHFTMLPPCQDHKRIFDNDQGPNTGGMGAFGPIPFLKEEDLKRLREELVEPTVLGLRAEGMDACGVFFLGVMWTIDGPKLLEYNVRFGDPETQVLMELLDEDLPNLLLDVATGRLGHRNLKLHPGSALVVVLASADYPETARQGDVIILENSALTVIHAGTKKKAGRWITHGGRVLNLVTLAPDLAAARARMESEIPKVNWDGMQYRHDIGLRALKHAEAGKTVQDPW